MSDKNSVMFNFRYEAEPRADIHKLAEAKGLHFAQYMRNLVDAAIESGISEGLLPKKKKKVFIKKVKM